jgi:hypothetical protein
MCADSKKPNLSNILKFDKNNASLNIVVHKSDKNNASYNVLLYVIF